MQFSSIGSHFVTSLEWYTDPNDFESKPNCYDNYSQIDKKKLIMIPMPQSCK